MEGVAHLIPYITSFILTIMSRFLLFCNKSRLNLLNGVFHHFIVVECVINISDEKLLSCLFCVIYSPGFFCKILIYVSAWGRPLVGVENLQDFNMTVFHWYILQGYTLSHHKSTHCNIYETSGLKNCMKFGLKTDKIHEDGPGQTSCAMHNMCMWCTQYLRIWNIDSKWFTSLVF
jgi:hypothetical protein